MVRSGDGSPEWGAAVGVRSGPNVPRHREIQLADEAAAQVVVTRLETNAAGKRSGEGGAVDRQERIGTALAEVVDGVGCELFTTPPFAAQEHRGFGVRGDALDLLLHLEQAGAPSDQMDIETLLGDGVTIESSGSPSSSSITMNDVPSPVSPSSKMSMTFGWASFFALLASRRKRSRTILSRASAGLRIFTAQGRSIRVWRAR